MTSIYITNVLTDLTSQISESLSTCSCITVLRRAAKVYINTRRFDRAEALIRHAVDLAAVVYGTSHPLYADTLQDYGFCLLHLDLVSECVVVSVIMCCYRTACVLGSHNSTWYLEIMNEQSKCVIFCIIHERSTYMIKIKI